MLDLLPPAFLQLLFLFQVPCRQDPFRPHFSDPHSDPGVALPLIGVHQNFHQPFNVVVGINLQIKAHLHYIDHNKTKEKLDEFTTS